MHEDDSGVAMSHRLCRATPGSMARTTAAVSGFGRNHGMLAPVLTPMAAAVSEALVQVFDAENDAVDRGDGVDVDAATDGVCLTVRLRGWGRWPESSTSGRLSLLADRVELSFDEHSHVMTVLLEFPADGTATRAHRCSRSPAKQRRRNGDFAARRTRRWSRHPARR